MNQSGKSNLLIKLQYVPLIAALAYIGLNIVVVALRITYPFELEWMEGAIVDHVIRVLEGHPLYVEPSLEFIPFIYPPLYYYIAALFSKIVGVGFFAPRLVSYLSALFCFYFIFMIVRKKTGSVLWGVVSAGLFAATYPVAGDWFDIARVDMLALLLTLAPIYLVFCRERTGTAFWAGLLVALAFFTKQTMILIAAPLALHYLIHNRKKFVIFSATVLVISLGGTLLLDFLHDGWYTYYLFNLPAGQEIYNYRYTTFWTDDLLPYLSVGVFLALVYIFKPPYKNYPRERLGFVTVLIVLLIISLMGRIHSAGWINVLVPALAGISLTVGLLTGEFFSKIYKNLSGRNFTMGIILIAAVTYQLGWLYYNPADCIPDRSDREAGEKLFEKLKPFEGNIIFPWHGYYPRMAGGGSWAHMMAYQDVRRAGDTSNADKYYTAAKEAVKNKIFTAIVTEKLWPKDEVLKYYRIYDRTFDDSEVFFPVTGFQVRPKFILIPQEAETATVFSDSTINIPPEYFYEQFLSLTSHGTQEEHPPLERDRDFSGWKRLLHPDRVHVFGRTVFLQAAFQVRHGDSLYLLFEFEALKQIDINYKISIHLLGTGKTEGEFYNFDFVPEVRTTAWRPGQRVICSRAIPALPERYILSLSLFAGDQKLDPPINMELHPDE